MYEPDIRLFDAGKAKQGIVNFPTGKGVVSEKELVVFLVRYGAIAKPAPPGAESVAEIKKMVEATRTLQAHNATPQFFDALSQFSDEYPALCNTITAIDIHLVAKKFSEEQLDFVVGVLNEVFLRTKKLECLTLQYFPSQVLVGSLATLDLIGTLAAVDLQHNFLDLGSFLFILKSLPDVDLALDVRNNLIEDEATIALLLTGYTNVRSLNILYQSNGRLDEDLLKERQKQCNDMWCGQIF